VEAVASLDEILHALPVRLEEALTHPRLELDLVGLAEAAELIGICRAALSDRLRCHPSFRCRWPSCVVVCPADRIYEATRILTIDPD
jgi:hypothetical protein